MTEETNAGEREDLIEKVAEEFLQQLRQNKQTSISEYVAEYPDLSPDLEKRLKLIESIFKSARVNEAEKTQVESIDLIPASDKTGRVSSTVEAWSAGFAARIACPHCGNKVQLVGPNSNEVTCGSCGSSVKVVRPPIEILDDSVLPNRLGRFKIKRILGQGAFGIVFLARDPQLDREVALKTPRNGYFATLDEERRFFREAKHAARLRHPNIVQVYEVCENEGAPLIVSEFIDGLTLNDIASGNLLTFKETARLMIQIANAVEFAHKKGVVHRDLKPSNILVDEDRNAYITDFGLAYRDDAEITMTLDGAILGTPAYMAPEQAEGNQKLTGRRSDVYSLGVILYRLTTKDLPFHGTKRMLVQQVINDEPKAPRSLNDRIPRDLETITLKAMSKSPEARYQSAAELADDLQRYLMGEPILARPEGNLAKLTRWCAKRPAIAALSGSIAALLILCATISTVWALNANHLKRIAIENGTRASQNAKESSQRLRELMMNNGIKELENNNLTNSALWFAEALSIEDTPNDRVRIAMLQDRMPTLTNIVTGTAPLHIAYSKDGSRLARADSKRVRVFDTLTMATLFDEPIDVRENFRLSPDGKLFAVALENTNAKAIGLWNIDNGGMTSTLRFPANVQNFEFDADSSKLLAYSDDSIATVVNVRDGSTIGQHRFDDSIVARAVFINQSNFVALELAEKGELASKLIFWDYVQDQLVGQEMPHDAFVRHLRISASGKQLCAGDESGMIKIWDISSGNQIGSSIITYKKILDAQFTDNDKAILALFANGEVATYDRESGRLLNLFASSNTSDILRQSPDSSILALGSAQGKAMFVWRKSGNDACTAVNNGPLVTAIAFHPNGHQVAIAGNGGALQIWDLAGSSPNYISVKHSDFVNTTTFIPNSSRCLTTFSGGKGYIWDALTGQRIGEEFDHPEGIFCTAVSPNGKLFATGGLNNSVHLWDSLTGRPVGTPLSHEAKIQFVRFSSDSAKVFSGDKNGTIRCWDIRTVDATDPRPLFEVQQNAEISALRISPDGSVLASSSSDGSIRFWEAPTGKPISAPFKLGNSRPVFRFLPDGKRLIIGGARVKEVVILDIASGAPLQRLVNNEDVSDIEVTENGKQIFIVGIQGAATVWTADETGKFSMGKNFHLAANAYALSGALSGKDSIFTMGGGMLILKPLEPQRGVISIWNQLDRRPLAPTIHLPGAVQQIEANESLQRIVTICDDRSTQIWNIKTTEVPQSDLKRIAQLYAQFVPDSQGGLQQMELNMQRTEFDELRTKYPGYFALEEAEINTWQDEIAAKSIEAQP